MYAIHKYIFVFYILYFYLLEKSNAKLFDSSDSFDANQQKYIF